jgi:hypothetical protein
MQTLFGYLTPIIALLLDALLLFRELRRKKLSAAADNKAAIAEGQAWQRIKTLLTLALPNIITDAENKYIDPGAGELKMSYAIAKIMELIPPDIRGSIKADWLQDFIEQALTGVMVIWDAMPHTLQRVQMEEIRAETEAEEDTAGTLTDAICEAVCEAVAEEIARLQAEDEDALAKAVSASGEDGKRSLTFHLRVEVSSDADENCLAEVTPAAPAEEATADAAEPAEEATAEEIVAEEPPTAEEVPEA